ncbi:2-succinyl-5-enolpyruvyl-6-hydroxy-3-cyclohexene-1-carboxylic-acid synthase [Staphylococcus pseudintermedius]|uniref:2-succinyl-5-enolpyruvyl-6-hydroxy-3- cyclohexene-1-carboxylic-acid synthase n=1 Tax=Staphylococcus pseudintermedius TaxID=283734 RepID=UPI001933C1EF|nr:2-succinyl-5-enolpyruvyl-6-hydroxy-3-cyclohexene-1-carboxylic-acid synthase [Staphylococcus pseudintermedius]EGQ4133674.1 2-succinyl-5-enolpyruvyl-6-hydroxy-3-cyclohexene-1-carboxylic-acid synthase [Staphylococcus pseudintermedius]EHK9623147.1 2-succinyl-5-enolpyruvyl-6-hydroxy-3-cyclohexene-1-carboxylic-acid synthase [Staphylococcus pseudintermedius]MBM0332404.1 2-succinyl-5-enolpyruvyl-6-hydroxy-3-cyclohexene-1-carboxylic-acid synthase [Staphylococcus pseudintermedius]MBM0349694.1 2-succin
MTNQRFLTEQVFHFVSELYAYGLREVVISPGSRSTPLALAFECHPYIQTWIHPDERSAAFFALGLIKGSQRPVAILCTSGTAAANYVPAIAESHISRLPLIVLTSDRPHELRGVGAPQAINQVNMFQNYVRFQFDLPIADGTPNTLAVNKYQLQKASQFFDGPHQGPVHFNLPFREPLTPDLSRQDLLTSLHYERPHYQKTMDFSAILPVLKQSKGLIVVGDMQHQDISQILTFATIYDLPILADPLNGIRATQHPNVVTTYDLLLRSGLNLSADFVIRVGKPVVSKKLNQWLKTTDATQILVQNNADIDAFPKNPDYFFEMSANDFFRALGDIPAAYRKMWLRQWQSMEEQARHTIKAYQKTANDEAAYVSRVLDKLGADDVLFVSNSMPIRDIDNLYIDHQARIYANRGANGIDGVVSTALGMAVHQKVTLLIGDIAFYHDMNGLLMSKLNDIHMNIVLLNNDGGGIFSYLPQKEGAPEHFERLFGTPTGLNFEHAALLYDFNYKRFQDLQSFEYSHLTTMTPTLFEVVTQREANYEAHQNLYQKLSEVVNVTL